MTIAQPFKVGVRSTEDPTSPERDGRLQLQGISVRTDVGHPAFSRPVGTQCNRKFVVPNLQRLGYCQPSLRDKGKILVALGILCAVSVAEADTVTLYPVEDATISEKSLESPLGTDSTLDSGTTGPNEGFKLNRALLRFDVAAVPSNATVTSAVLTLTLVTTPTSTNLWFSLHRMLQDWKENVVTWTNRLSPPAPWSVPGGASSVDYASAVTQSNLIVSTVLPAVFSFASNPAMVADVQEWLNNPSTNFGWILICELEELERSVRKFGSSERLSTNQRPYLEIQYRMPPAGLTLIPLQPKNGQFLFEFQVESNKSYNIMYTHELAETNWGLLTNIPALLLSTNIVISDTLTASNRFYRVVAP